MMRVGAGFMQSRQQFPQNAEAHVVLVRARAAESALDARTNHLARVAALCASGMSGGMEADVERPH